jgi:hypothetical protein
MKKLLKAAFRKLGFLVTSVSHPGARYLDHPPQSVFESVLLQRFPDLDSLCFIQVGANDGKRFDPLHPFVRRYRWRGVLVEPVPQNFRALEETYKGCPGLVLLQAVADASRGFRTMYFVREGTMGPDWIRGLATLNLPRLLETLRSIGMDERVVTSEELPALAWADIWQQLAGDRCDLLVLDTEGHDLVLLRAAGLAVHRPSIVHFEHQHFSQAERLQVYGELMDLGYEIATDENDTTAWLRARPVGAAGRSD